MSELERALRRADRERLARKQAESLLEQKSLELYQTNVNLTKARDELEARVVQRTQELNIALQAAEASNRIKGEFLANMSHELRTPMTAILGYSELLLDDEHLQPGKPQDSHGMGRQDIIRTIQKNGYHLLEIINDILDLSKIEAGKLDFHFTPCSLFVITEYVLTLLRVRAEEKGIDLNVQFERILHDQIRTDETRLRQILVNLIGNSIKFTESGTIKLIVRSQPKPEGDGKLCLVFDVIDSGIGMTKEVAARLFRPFTQADSSMTRQYGGTGLGLTISRRLAEQFGGGLEIVSTEPGKGSHFQLQIPYDFELLESSPDRTRLSNQKQAQSPVDSASKPLENVRILLAEDGPDNQRLISHVLRISGAEVVVVDNGQLAIDAIQEARETDCRFHTILMDMQMPVLDGYQASRHLRDANCGIPIIALTAHAMSEDRAKCLEAGCDDYTTKPINRTELIKLVAKYAADR